MRSLLTFLLLTLPLSAQTVTVTQVAGRRFAISGTGAGEGNVVVTGVATRIITVYTGIVPERPKGTWDDVIDVLAFGDITVRDSKGFTRTLTLANAAPTFGQFTVANGAASTVVLSGTVNHVAAAGMTVTLSGPMGIHGATAVVRANGGWSVTLPVTGVPSGATVTASVTDWYGLSATKTATTP